MTHYEQIKADLTACYGSTCKGCSRRAQNSMKVCNRLLADAAEAIGELLKRPDVVRCKDCVNYDARQFHPCKMFGINPGPDDFCRIGKRKEAEK